MPTRLIAFTGCQSGLRLCIGPYIPRISGVQDLGMIEMRLRRMEEQETHFVMPLPYDELAFYLCLDEYYPDDLLVF